MGKKKLEKIIPASKEETYERQHAEIVTTVTRVKGKFGGPILPVWVDEEVYFPLSQYPEGRIRPQK